MFLYSMHIRTVWMNYSDIILDQLFLEPQILRRWRHRWNKSGKETPLGYHEQVTKCIEIGSLCQKIDPYARPSISEIMRKFIEMESTLTVAQVSSHMLPRISRTTNHIYRNGDYIYFHSQRKLSMSRSSIFLFYSRNFFLSSKGVLRTFH
jgi:hypothetical protein